MVEAEFKPVSTTVLLNSLGLNERGQVQKYFDTMVAKELQPYVSFKSGTQERSILTSLVAGSGEVHIDVPYAEIQAYSRRIKKRVGKRGTQPFERMVADNKDKMLQNENSIFFEVQNKIQGIFKDNKINEYYIEIL